MSHEPERAADGDDFHIHWKCNDDGDFVAIWLVPRCARARRVIAKGIAQGRMAGPFTIDEEGGHSRTHDAYKVIDEEDFDRFRSLALRKTAS